MNSALLLRPLNQTGCWKCTTPGAAAGAILQKKKDFALHLFSGVAPLFLYSRSQMGFQQK
jgi:hypothetical protein